MGSDGQIWKQVGEIPGGRIEEEMDKVKSFSLAILKMGIILQIPRYKRYAALN